MGVLFTDSRTTLIARPQERSQAHDILEQAGGHVESLVVQDVDRKPFPVPRELAAVIAQVIEVMARGGTVVIGSLPEELTTTVAAEQLGISRPTLMKLIKDGEIDAHMVSTHHRLKSADVLAFKRGRLERQRAAFEELRALEDELTIG